MAYKNVNQFLPFQHIIDRQTIVANEASVPHYTVNNPNPGYGSEFELPAGQYLIKVNGGVYGTSTTPRFWFRASLLDNTTNKGVDSKNLSTSGQYTYNVTNIVQTFIGIVEIPEGETHRFQMHSQIIVDTASSPNPQLKAYAHLLDVWKIA